MATMTRWMFGGLAVAVAALFAAPGGHVAAAQAGPTFVLSPQTQTVDLSAGTVQVQVQVQNATNIAAFQFLLRYDRGVLSQPSVQVGSFIGSSGRFVQCQPAVVDNVSSYGAGTVLVGCATLSNQAGASGSGLLATVTFHLAGGAQTAVLIEIDSLAYAPYGDRVCGTDVDPSCPAQNGSITVRGGNPALDLGLTAMPPPASRAPSVPIGGAPVSGATPAPAGAASTGDSSTGNGAAAPGGAASPGSSAAPGPAGGPPSGTIAGASSGALSGGGAGAGTGAPGSGGRTVGSYGFGPPPPSHQQDRRDAIIAALALAALGLALLRAAAAVRPRM